ncbi:MAG: oligosaccharide flippase family protein [Acidobacteria bacterium]|nr:oligosaccharide flippase family protein [Acidobacteriota bacterium]
MGWSVAGAVVSRGLNLALAVASARLLGQMVFGELSMVQSTASMFTVFAGLGSGITATKHVAELRQKDPARAGRVLALSSLASLAAGALLTLVLLAAAPLLASRSLAAPHLAGPLRIASALLLLGALTVGQSGALAGFEAFRAVARINTITGLVSFPLVLLLIRGAGLEGGLWGLVGVMAVNCYLSQQALREECRKARVPFAFSGCWKEWPILWKFSLPAFASSAILVPVIWASNVMLARQPQGYLQLGIFSAADKWRLLLTFIPTSVAGIALPMLANLHSRGDGLSYRKILRANLILNLALTVVPALAAAAFAAPLMALYGEGYQAGSPAMVVLVLASVPTVLNTVLGQPVVANGFIWVRFGFDVLLAALLLGFARWMIPVWGAAGLAAAYGAAYSASSLGLFAFGRVMWGRVPHG